MRSYILVSGVIFMLVVATHVARVFAEGIGLLKQPSFVGTSILSLFLVVWAWRVYRYRGAK